MKPITINLSEEIYTQLEEMARNMKMPIEQVITSKILQRFDKGFIKCEICENIIPNDPVYRPGIKVVQCPFCGEEMEFDLERHRDIP